nr:hypothetical protein [Tanacetum cinerariifolium]
MAKDEVSIKYALTVNPNIYVSCIKQFWTSVVVKKVNDVTRLQALVDKKKVVITEASIRDALHLDDAEGVECLPNEEIFTELARIGYEKPSTKLTFYKAFFSSQWKFLIHTILQCMSAKRTSWNEFSSSMASAVIYLSSGRKFNFLKYIFDRLVRNVDSPTKFYMYPRFQQLMIRKQVGDLSSHSTKYTFPTMTQKVFANMRWLGKGFSEVDTPLFEGMLVAQEVGEDVDEVHVEDVNAAGVVAEGAASDDVNAAIDEPSIPLPPPPNPPPQPSQDIPSTSQDAGISMDLIQNLMDTCTTLSRRVEHLELDKIAQALEITKLKQRVKKLERRNKLKLLKLRRLKRVGSAQRIDTSDDTVMDDDVTVEKSANVQESADDQGSKAKSQAEIYKIDLEHAKKVLNMQEEESEPAELQEVVDVVTTTKIITEVVTAASDTITAASTTITAADISSFKRKPHTEVQARKNMMINLRNVTGFKMDYFKGVTYDDICLIFEKHFDSNVAFLQKTKEKMDEEDSRALKRLNESQEEKAAKKQKLEEEVEELERHLQIVPNDDDDVYTEATPLALKVPVVDYEI